jgi:hypothetical protein
MTYDSLPSSDLQSEPEETTAGRLDSLSEELSEEDMLCNLSVIDEELDPAFVQAFDIACFT